MANEKRLIDANAADVERIPCYYGDHCYTEDVQEWLNEQPTVDAVEVVHGRWINHYHDSGEPLDDKWYCSECHMCNDHRRTWYCPNCGAKMDGDENGMQ